MDHGSFCHPPAGEIRDAYARQGHEGCGRIIKFGDKVKDTELKLVRQSSCHLRTVRV